MFAVQQVNSFSKYAGFTGVRLGWTIVPEGLMYADGSQVKKDYERVMVKWRLLEMTCSCCTTIFPSVDDESIGPSSFERFERKASWQVLPAYFIVHFST